MSVRRNQHTDTTDKDGSARIDYYSRLMFMRIRHIQPSFSWVGQPVFQFFPDRQAPAAGDLSSSEIF